MRADLKGARMLLEAIGGFNTELIPITVDVPEPNNRSTASLGAATEFAGIQN